MTLPARLPFVLGSSPTGCWDPNHFEVVDNQLRPQPWMQWRSVGSIVAPTRTGSYAVTGGGNKNELLHSLRLSWHNDTPIDQWCYGIVTRGGSRVTLQARSRGYLQTACAFATGIDSGPLSVSSHHGVGADTGVGGVLAIGSQFTVAEDRANTVTMPLVPGRTGWLRIAPGISATAHVEVRFVTQFWESSAINGGSSGTESSFESGITQLDLFAVPALDTT